MRVIGIAAMMFMVGCSASTCALVGPDCSSVYSESCDIPTMAWVIGGVLGVIGLIGAIKGVDKD